MCTVGGKKAKKKRKKEEEEEEEHFLMGSGVSRLSGTRGFVSAEDSSDISKAISELNELRRSLRIKKAAGWAEAASVKPGAMSRVCSGVGMLALSRLDSPPELPVLMVYLIKDKNGEFAVPGGKILPSDTDCLAAAFRIWDATMHTGSQQTAVVYMALWPNGIGKNVTFVAAMPSLTRSTKWGGGTFVQIEEILSGIDDARRQKLPNVHLRDIHGLDIVLSNAGMKVLRTVAENERITDLYDVVLG